MRRRKIDIDISIDIVIAYRHRHIDISNTNIFYISPKTEMDLGSGLTWARGQRSQVPNGPGSNALGAANRPRPKWAPVQTVEHQMSMGPNGPGAKMGSCPNGPGPKARKRAQACQGPDEAWTKPCKGHPGQTNISV